jgi:hypothetical protein
MRMRSTRSSPQLSACERHGGPKAGRRRADRWSAGRVGRGRGRGRPGGPPGRRGGGAPLGRILSVQRAQCADASPRHPHAASPLVCADTARLGVWTAPDGPQVAYIDSVTGGNAWTASSPGAGLANVPASVPGDLITDLQNAKRVGDPLYDLNWLRDSHVWNENTWEYSTTFQLPAVAARAASQAGGEVLLVFDGIKVRWR